MSVRDITPGSVYAAIVAGYDDIEKLAQRFEVLPTSRFLADALEELERQRRIFPGALTLVLGGDE